MDFGTKNNRPNYQKRFAIWLTDSNSYLKYKYGKNLELSKVIEQSMTFDKYELAKAYANRHGFIKFEIRPAYIAGEK